jgi:UDP-glucose 4-epimerase
VYDVAVVGSRGFLGSAITAELAQRGASVGGFTRDSPYIADGRLAAEAKAVVWSVRYVTPADPRRGGEALLALSGLIEAAQRAEHVPHIVLLSSGGAVYGPPAQAPFVEDSRPSPANEYGRVKFNEERLLADAGIDHTVLRISNPYGPLQATGALPQGQGVVGHWLAAVHAGEPITIFGDGSAVRDYVYIDDVAQAVATAALGQPGGIINVGSGEGTSLAQLLEVVRAAVANSAAADPGGTPREIEVARQPPRGVDPAAAWLDVERAKEVLGWSATTSLADGIARTWAAVDQ